MSSLVTEMDWEALVEILQETVEILQKHEMEPVKQGLLEVSSTASMLELEDLGQTVEGFKEYLLAEVSPAWEETKVAALRSAVTFLVAAMQKHFYGPAFKEILKKVEIREAPQEETPFASPEPPVSELAPQAEEPPPVIPSPSPTIPSEELTIPFPVEAALPAADVADLEPLPAPPLPEAEAPEVIAAQELTAEREKPRAVEREVEEEVTVSVEIKEDRGEATSPDSVESYRAFLNLDPTSSVFVLLAEEYCRRRQWREAVMTCRRGLTAHPRDIRGRALLGWALAELGQWEEAKSWLTLARRDLEANALIYEVLARMADAQGDHKKAQEFTAVFHTLQAQFDEKPASLVMPEFLETQCTLDPAAVSQRTAHSLESASPLSSLPDDLPGASPSSTRATPFPIQPKPAGKPSASSRVFETLTGWLELLEQREAFSSQQSGTLFSDREKSLLRQFVQEAGA